MNEEVPSLVGEYLHGSHTAEWVHTEEMLGTARFKVSAPVQVSRFRLGHVVDPPMEFSVFPSQFLHKRAKFFMSMIHPRVVARASSSD